MNVLRTLRPTLHVALLLLLSGVTASAQYAPGATMPPAGAIPPGGVMQAGYGAANGMFVDPAVAYAGCDACDAYGNGIAGGGGAGFGMGAGWNQCGPHYYDISADFLYWRRDRSADPALDYSSLGTAINAPRVLSSGDLEMDYEPGFRVTGRLDISALAFVEASYFGTFHWTDRAEVQSNGQLFSRFSNFGQDLPQPIESEAANLHAIELSSELHNAEINWRRYWVGGHPAVTGTFLLGARYVRLTEDFNFRSESNAGMVDYDISTENDLIGFQTGGDIAFCLRQGLRIVGTGEVGIYNNRAKQVSLLDATSIFQPQPELADTNSVAFVGEGGISVVADILPSLSVRAGYEVLYLNSVALAQNNFNAQSDVAARVPIVNDNGQALYHGFYGGLEYTW